MHVLRSAARTLALCLSLSLPPTTPPFALPWPPQTKKGTRTLLLSSLGTGTYLGPADASGDEPQLCALLYSVSRGWNVIDTGACFLDFVLLFCYCCVRAVFVCETGGTQRWQRG